MPNYTSRKIEEFYKPYEEGRIAGAPLSYIDYFKAREFLYKCLEEQKAEVVKMVEERMKRLQQEIHDEKKVTGFSSDFTYYRLTEAQTIYKMLSPQPKGEPNN